MRAAFFVTSDGVAIPKARPVTPRLRRCVFDRDGWACTSCGRAVEWNAPRCQQLLDWRTVGHVDHVFPRARGGPSTPDNLRLLCAPCNLSKAAD